jgi:hypothetical protein
VSVQRADRLSVQRLCKRQRRQTEKLAPPHRSTPVKGRSV